jgi:hypothetical protein
MLTAILGPERGPRQWLGRTAKKKSRIGRIEAEK